MYYCLAIIFLFFTNVYSQNFKLYEDNFIVTHEDRILNFSKTNDSIFSSISYGFNYRSKRIKEFNVEQEQFFRLWSLSIDKIKINANVIDLGSPSDYVDLYKKYIISFLHSDEWKIYVKKNGFKYSSYDNLSIDDLVKKMIIKSEIFDDFDQQLNKLGLKIHNFEVEKIDFISKKSVKFRKELSKEEKKLLKCIPMPLILQIKVEKI